MTEKVIECEGCECIWRIDIKKELVASLIRCPICRTVNDKELDKQDTA